jgi:acyl dehydratase
MSSPDDLPGNQSPSLCSAKPRRGDLQIAHLSDGGLETAAPSEEAHGSARLAWILILTVAVIGATFALSCVTPFAALAVALAGTVGLRLSLRIVAIVWFANQMIGFVFFHFPQTANTCFWAVAIGGAAFLTTIVASLVGKQGSSWPAPVRLGGAVLVSFVVYEMTLLPVAVLLNGLETFQPAIIAQLGFINVFSLLAMIALNEVLAAFLKPWVGTMPRLAKAS